MLCRTTHITHIVWCLTLSEIGGEEERDIISWERFTVWWVKCDELGTGAKSEWTHSSWCQCFSDLFLHIWQNMFMKMLILCNKASNNKWDKFPPLLTLVSLRRLMIFYLLLCSSTFDGSSAACQPAARTFSDNEETEHVIIKLSALD